jgi:hypothetical protein
MVLADIGQSRAAEGKQLSLGAPAPKTLRRIERLSRRDRITVEADRGTRVPCSLSVMTRPTQTLQRAEGEAIPIAPCWLMVDGVGERDDAALETFATQRLAHQLLSATPRPPTSFVEGVRLRHRLNRLMALHVGQAALTNTSKTQRSLTR